MLDAVDPTNVDSKGIPFTVRTVFVIDPKKVIRLTISYPAQTGRNFDEIIRVIDSLQLGDKHKVSSTVRFWCRVKKARVAKRRINCFATLCRSSRP